MGQGFEVGIPIQMHQRRKLVRCIIETIICYPKYFHLLYLALVLVVRQVWLRREENMFESLMYNPKNLGNLCRGPRLAVSGMSSSIESLERVTIQYLLIPLIPEFRLLAYTSHLDQFSLSNHRPDNRVNKFW